MVTTSTYRLFHSALVRMFFGLIICFASLIIGQQLFLTIPGVSSLGAGLRNFLKGIFASSLVLGSYWLFYSKYEKRKITELSALHLGNHLLTGSIIGGGLQALTILVIYLFGGFVLIAVNPVSSLVIPFTVAFTVAILEEVLLRGIIFRLAEEKFGSVIAIIISSAIFGGLHIFNPHITVVSIICIVAVGVLLAAAYMYYRSIWVPIAIHFTWNFIQNGIFGAITSGNEKLSSLFTSKISGPELLTGGEFGPEGSVQAVLFCTVAAIVILWKLNTQNKFLRYNKVVAIL